MSSKPSLPPSQQAPDPNATMSALGHLGELRQRLLMCLAMYTVAALLVYTYVETLFGWLCFPLRHLPQQKMIVLGPLELFLVYIKLSLIGGLLLSLPFILWQLWRFVSPGLYPHERRLILPFVISGTLLFALGMAFCFFWVLPWSFAYLVGMVPPSIEAHYSVSNYFALVSQLMLAFGLVFEMPLLMSLLIVAGLVDVPTLKRWRRYWFLVALVVAGVLTPTPDPFTQLIMALPLWLFYELGIVLGGYLQRKRQA